MSSTCMGDSAMLAPPEARSWASASRRSCAFGADEAALASITSFKVGSPAPTRVTVVLASFRYSAPTSSSKILNSTCNPVTHVHGVIDFLLPPNFASTTYSSSSLNLMDFFNLENHVLPYTPSSFFLYLFVMYSMIENTILPFILQPTKDSSTSSCRTCSV